MEIFKLPHTTKVNKVIPKNAFDSYTNTKQKKMISELIARITWLHKLSTDTINLEAKEIKEIQIFKIELKTKEEIQPLLNIIDKAIPYNIIFIVEFEEQVYLSTSTKHPHPVNEDNAVIDWTFKTSWFLHSATTHELQLKKNIDAMYLDFCTQLSAKPTTTYKSLHDLIQYNQQISTLEKEISQLQQNIKNTKHFKHKVELNNLLKKLTKELKLLLY